MKLRARLSFTVGDRSIQLEVVARRESEELVLVGLASYGVRLFAVRQRGRELEVDAPAGGRIRRVAEWTADALHRLYWIQPPASDSSDGPASAASDGRMHWDREGERATQWSEDGRVHREFARGASSPSSEGVSIDYPVAGGTATDAGAAIRNPWCGYEARVVILEAAPSDPVPRPARAPGGSG